MTRDSRWGLKTCKKKDFLFPWLIAQLDDE